MSNSEKNNAVPDTAEDARQGCCWRLGRFLRSSNFLLYLSHTLSSGGDRMWSFAVGLFLITLSPGSLRLTAIYGFVSGGSILLLGALIGDAVDRCQRLRVAQTALLVNNLSTAVCAVIVCLTLIYVDVIQTTWNGWLEVLCQAAIVITATCADLAGVARVISIERDWIVVMCAGDKQELTKLSAFLRRIDLVTNLVAPIVTGQIITYGSSVIGAVFLGAWNLLFMFVEYSLLYAIYKRVPELAVKKGTELEASPQTSFTAIQEDATLQTDDKVSEKTSLTASQEAAIILQAEESKCLDHCAQVFSVFITTARGWRTYVRQEILPAGLALSLLYMTVIGFDNITNGYAVEQGLTESIIGILRGVGAILGVLGTVIYPILRKRFGLKVSGVIAFYADIGILTMCVASVFVAGSPFTPDFYINPEKYTQPDILQGVNGTQVVTAEAPHLMLSIWLLMVGIVLSRCTLWMADLTVTQLLIEEPKPEVRGIVNGVQNALNKFMDLIKFALVIFLPLEETFGYLILASFTCVSLGGVFFTVYACKPSKLEVHAEKDIKDSKHYEDIS